MHTVHETSYITGQKAKAIQFLFLDGSSWRSIRWQNGTLSLEQANILQVNNNYDSLTAKVIFVPAANLTTNKRENKHKQSFIGNL